jgi:hypothetical protein
LRRKKKCRQKKNIDAEKMVQKALAVVLIIICLAISHAGADGSKNAVREDVVMVPDTLESLPTTVSISFTLTLLAEDEPPYSQLANASLVVAFPYSLFGTNELPLLRQTASASGDEEGPWFACEHRSDLSLKGVGSIQSCAQRVPLIGNKARSEPLTITFTVPTPLLIDERVACLYRESRSLFSAAALTYLINDDGSTVRQNDELFVRLQKIDGLECERVQPAFPSSSSTTLAPEHAWTSVAYFDYETVPIVDPITTQVLALPGSLIELANVTMVNGDKATPCKGIQGNGAACKVADPFYELATTPLMVSNIVCARGSSEFQQPAVLFTKVSGIVQQTQFDSLGIVPIHALCQ